MPRNAFAGRVTDDGSRIDLEYPKAMKAHVKTLAGKRVTVTIVDVKSRRSLKQNAWLHGPALSAIEAQWSKVCEVLGADIGYEQSEMKLVLLGEFFGYKWNAIAKKDVPVKAHTSELTTKEFSALMSWLPDWAGSQFNISIPLPDDDIPVETRGRYAPKT